MIFCAVWTSAASAQSTSRAYPYKPIRWVTGGGPDAMARILGQKITEAWGQQVVVEERGGGGGMLSAEIVSRATPDGYTLLLATGTHTISPNYFKLSYDMQRDFTAVSLLGTITFILSVHPSLPVNNVQELIALARAKPGTLNYTSGGNGSPGHIIMEYLNEDDEVLVVTRTTAGVRRAPCRNVTRDLTQHPTGDRGSGHGRRASPAHAGAGQGGGGAGMRDGRRARPRTPPGRGPRPRQRRRDLRHRPSHLSLGSVGAVSRAPAARHWPRVHRHGGGAG